MPLSRYPTQTQNSLVTRYGVHQENKDAVGGKAALKTRAAGTRAALGDIGNQVNTRAQVKKQEISKPVTRLAKSKATSSLLEAVKVSAPEPVAVPESKSPAPMDISASEAFSQIQIQPVDIDKDDKDNPQLVSQYVNKIYDYMRELEQKLCVKYHYLEGRDVNARMRGILVDWLVQVHMRFHLLQETLYLTVGILDRFLQVHEVSRKKLQLVGVTAMLIASKYEEMYAPEIGDFVYITDNAYTSENIRQMECLILQTLDFNLGKPLPLHFLRRNSKAGEVDATKHTLAKYLMELTIVDYDMAHIHPSEIAAAALCLSMKIIGNVSWTPTLVHHSKYTEEQVLPTMKKMAVLLQKASTGKLTAIHTKYKSSKFLRISILPDLKAQIISELADEQ